MDHEDRENNMMEHMSIKYLLTNHLELEVSVKFGKAQATINFCLRWLAVALKLGEGNLAEL